MQIKAHFITACILQKTIRTIKVDKAAHDYYMRLTTFYAQFRAIGVNYNQIVKLLHVNFSERKAKLFLYKLEIETIKIIAVYKEIVKLTQEFEEKHFK